MRPVEALLSLANLLTFVALAVPLPRPMRWMRRSPPVALLTAFAQMLAEGPRWQMLPAYALAGLFVLVWLLQDIAHTGGLTKQKRTNRMAVGLGVLVLAASIVLPMMIPVFRFPHPSGPYGIGTLTYHWVDPDRPEIFSTDPKARRELMVQIWYPARDDTSSPRAPYLADADAVTTAFARIHEKPAFMFGQPTCDRDG